MNATTTNTNNNRRKLEGLPSQLPLRSPEHIEAVFKANDMPFRIPEVGGYSLNCWGFVALNQGWINCPCWLDGHIMDGYLDTKTVPVAATDVEMGDIAVFRRRDGYLTHTALMTCDPTIVCHKCGSGAVCIDTLDNAHHTYPDVITFVRPKSNLKKVEESH